VSLDVKLLRGDLAEAWREGNADYATVAMNFALKDSMVERARDSNIRIGAVSGQILINLRQQLSMGQ